MEDREGGAQSTGNVGPKQGQKAANNCEGHAKGDVGRGSTNPDHVLNHDKGVMDTQVLEVMEDNNQQALMVINDRTKGDAEDVNRMRYAESHEVVLQEGMDCGSVPHGSSPTNLEAATFEHKTVGSNRE